MSSTDFFDDDLLRGKDKPAQPAPALGSEIRVSGAGMPRDELPARPVSDLNLTRMAKHRDEVNTQVAGAMKEIECLRRKQEELAREKQALEDLSRKQDDYERGKREMIDNLEQSLPLLEKHEVQATRLAEIYTGTRQRFQEMLQQVQRIDDTSWPENAIRDELMKAIVMIDDVRKEYHKALAKIDASGGFETGTTESQPAAFVPGGQPAGSPPPFSYWVKVGFAVTLPLIIVIVVLFLLVLATSGKGL